VTVDVSFYRSAPAGCDEDLRSPFLAVTDDDVPARRSTIPSGALRSAVRDPNRRVAAELDFVARAGEIPAEPLLVASGDEDDPAL
jgi:hypothetical protein